MIAVDTNVVVRFITGDDFDQNQRVRLLLEANDIYVPATVWLEAEWVLRSVYDYAPSAIIDALEAFAGLPSVTPENPRLLHLALTLARQGLELADAMHLANAEDCVGFASFDRALIKKARRIAPIPIVEF